MFLLINSSRMSCFWNHCLLVTEVLAMEYVSTPENSKLVAALVIICLQVLLVIVEDRRSVAHNNCHIAGPTARCPCKSDNSFVIQSPVMDPDFKQQKRLLILDIDETILQSTRPMLGNTLIRNDSPPSTRVLLPDVDGMWQSGFEMFHLHELNISSIVRPQFFKTLDFVLNHEFNVILYTRAGKQYANLIHGALVRLYLRWKIFNEGGNITKEVFVGAHFIFNMLIATEGAGKTLELIHDFIDLSLYEAILILDDAAHGVWCMEWMKQIRPQPKFILIKPNAFEPWNAIRRLWTMHNLEQDSQAAIAGIRGVIGSDTFFSSLRGFLKFYSRGNISKHEEIYEKVLDSCSKWKTKAKRHPLSWWEWDPALKRTGDEIDGTSKLCRLL